METIGNKNKEYADIFAKCIASLQMQDRTSFLTAGFNTFLTTQLPLVIEQQGSFHAFHKGWKYEFSLSKPRTFNSPASPTDCFDFALAKTIPITAKLKLTATNTKTKEQHVLYKVRTTIVNWPIPTGRSLRLYEPVYDDKHDIRNQFLPSGCFIINGKLRSLPCIKVMSNSKMLLVDKRKSQGFVMLQVRSAHWKKPFRKTSSINFIIDTKNKKAECEGVVSCELPHAKSYIHVGVLAQALGCNPKSFIQLIQVAMGDLYDPILFRPYEISFVYDKENKQAKTQELAMKMIAKIFQKKEMSTGFCQVKTEVLSHINIELEETKQFELLHKYKLIFLAKCVGLLILFEAGKIEETSRDWFRYCSIVTPVQTMGEFFKKALKEHMKKRERMFRRTFSMQYFGKKINRKRKKEEEKQNEDNIKKQCLQNNDNNMTNHDTISNNNTISNIVTNNDTISNDTTSNDTTSNHDTNNNDNKTKLKTEFQPLQLNLVSLFGESKLSNRVLSAIANGAFYQNKGVTKSMNLNNTDAILDQLECIQSSLNKTDSSHTEPRQVQFDGYGFIGAEYSPDGENVGLKMKLAMFATVTLELENPQFLANLLESLLSPYLLSLNTVLGAKLNQCLELSQNSQQNSDSYVDFKEWKSTYYTYFNNCGIITHFVEEKHIINLIALFRLLRRRGILPWSTFLELYEKRKEIHICCSGGQLARPLIVAENLHLAKPFMTFHDMMINGIIEYVNVAELETICKIATCFEDFFTFASNATHIELNQVAFLSSSVAGVPFVSSQHGPRVTHFSQQIKQTMTAEPKEQHGYVFHTQLAYAHKSLITSQTAMNHISSLPIGKHTLCTIAFLADQTQEDANQLSRASCDRGLFCAYSTRYYTSDATPTSNVCKEKFEKPSIVLARKNTNYNTVDDNGLAKEHILIPGGGIVIAKTKSTTRVKLKQTKKRKYMEEGNTMVTTRDISTTARLDEGGKTTFKKKVCTPCGERVTVGLTKQHICWVGDKLTNRYSGKGIASTRTNQEDLPFSLETGCVCDIYISPISPAARMTLSCLLECLTGKVVGISANLKYGFDSQDLHGSNIQKEKELSNILTSFGFSCRGTETFICGKTGQLFTSRVFCGLVEVARLNHIASKKIHARGYKMGPRDILTRQPKAKKINEGGLRAGEMEMVSMASYGAAFNLQTRSNFLSDPHIVYICSKCKMVADGNEEIEYMWCRSCQSNVNILQVTVPFTFLVCVNELLAMGIVIRIAVEEQDCIDNHTGEDIWLKAYEHCI